MYRISFFLILMGIASLFAQTEGVGINQTGNDPDLSAILDVQSSTKGLLIPRMSSTDRAAISNPATGLMVYDNTTQSFWYFDGMGWEEIGNPDISRLQDADVDTRVEVEASPDEDAVRFTTQGEERFIVDRTGIFSAGVVNLDDDVPYGGAGSRFMWIPGMAAVRIGEVSGTQWDGGNLGLFSSVLGGFNNAVISGAEYSSIGGGLLNTVTSDRSVIGGGQNNNVRGRYGVVSGGDGNEANASWSVVSGGFGNRADGERSMISGGQGNTTLGQLSAIPGGIGNVAWSYGEVTLGLWADFYTPISDSNFQAQDRILSVGNGTDISHRSNALTILKNGHTGLGTSTPDATLHVVGQMRYEDGNQADGYVLTSNANGVATWRSGPSPTGILQGTDGAAYNLRAFASLVGPQMTLNTGDPRGEYSVDLQTSRFDPSQVASKPWSTISGGANNTASGDYSVVGGGDGNRSEGNYTAIGGGNRNIAFGRYSTIPGGIGLKANTFAETALGYFNEDISGEDSIVDALDPLFVVGNGDVFNRSNALTLLKNGNLGLGTSSPQNILDIEGGLAVGTNYSGTNAAPSNGAIFEGNVGIGTNTPQHMLHLGGTSGRKLALFQDAAGEDFYGFGVGPDLLEFYAGVTSTDDPNMVINRMTGNVGIGTTNPQSTLDVEGGISIGVAYSGASTAPANGAIIEGSVGIGTNNPTRAKLEISGGPTATLGNVGFLPFSGNTGNGPTPPTYQYSLYADQRIAALEVFAHSDRRIKNIQGISDAETDLSTLMQIEVTDYRLKDSIAKGTHEIKKVIAQQVAEVYPQAVNTDLTEIVPDIYQRAEVQDGWIMLATDLQVGERVKLITEKASEVYEVSAVETNRFQVSPLASDSDSGLTSQVFVYGREVDDFHTVDYEALSMLNVSATQEQQRRIEALEEENATKQAEIASLRAKVEQLQGLEVRLQALEALLPPAATQAEVSPR